MPVQNFDSFDAIKTVLPDYAKDLKLNLSSLLEDESLTAQQRCGVFLASALATHSAPVIKAAETLAKAHLGPEAQAAAKAAAAVMAMNNIYYRFVHLISDADYAKMPAKLRMNVIGRPGIEKADFELYALAVSAINGCGMCVDSHEKILRQAGVPAEAIQTAVRIAAVLHAIARTLDGEAALAA